MGDAGRATQKGDVLFKGRPLYSDRDRVAGAPAAAEVEHSGAGLIFAKSASTPSRRRAHSEVHRQPVAQ